MKARFGRHSSRANHFILSTAAQGTATLLGPLEASVMDALWVLHVPTPTKGVVNQLRTMQPYTPTLNTVHRTLGRLVDKGFVIRSTRDHTMLYAPRMNKQMFYMMAAHALIQTLSDLVGPDMLRDLVVGGGNE